MKTVNCDLCGSNDYKTKFEIEISENVLRYYRYSRNIPQKEKMTENQTIVECNECGLIYTNPRFSTEELNLVYSSDKVLGGNWKNFWYLFNSKLPDSFEAGEKKNSYNPNLYQWKFDIINKYFPHKKGNAKLLDIGCGDGRFVYDAIQKGYNAMGIDLSPDRISKGKKIYNLSDSQIACMNVDDFSGDQKFDVIVMWDVIEHVESPSLLLNSIKKICHSKTKIFALTMSVDSITYKLFKKDWNYINPTQHLHYFSHSTLKKMFEKSGFKLLGVEMDNSKSKNIIHLLARVLVGRLNLFFFKTYTKNRFYKFIFKPLQAGISDKRLLKRIENLYPGKYIGRYHDNFVFIGELEDKQTMPNKSQTALKRSLAGTLALIIRTRH